MRYNITFNNKLYHTYNHILESARIRIPITQHHMNGCVSNAKNIVIRGYSQSKNSPMKNYQSVTQLEVHNSQEDLAYRYP